MGNLAKILAILFFCFAGCWLLSHAFPVPPSTIPGTVINWITKKPMPNVKVRIRYDEYVAQTDENGQFTMTAPGHKPKAYFLYAGGHSKLLQDTVGQTVILDRQGRQITNVIVPAIPAAEISGHVYAMDGQPIAGCKVMAVTHMGSSPKRVRGESKKIPWDRVEEVNAFIDQDEQQRNPDHLLRVQVAQTDEHGGYSLIGLSPDRYHVVADCNSIQDGERIGISWRPAVHPKAASIEAGVEITLLPGDVQSGIDVQVEKRRGYSVRGKIVFSEGSIPHPGDKYSYDLVLARSDRSLIGPENCGWYDNSFTCYTLFPGTYTLFFNVGQSPDEAQVAEASYTVTATGEQPPLSVHLHQVPKSKDVGVQKGRSGLLKIQDACIGNRPDRFAIRVVAWGTRSEHLDCDNVSRFQDGGLRLPEAQYALEAFEDSFIRPEEPAWDLGNKSKVEELLMRHGTPVQIRAGQTTTPNLQIIRTGQIIDMALDSLRQ